MTLISGAGGKTGRALIRVLAAWGETVRAFVHREEQAPAMKAAGAHDVVAGDLRTPTRFSEFVERRP